ncbi:MAG: nitroreductase family protein [Paracoccus sp. (in: a-proteobacteria)]|uniref:nitroreductase family protein n=1 Tax=Paracoccus sp. TaxID=267 RepID=UPI0026DFA5A1|nr:nitroreductase family protein [Paracoccus sp. (in: a-proteobacteria)]MDO5620698.1 nitroreductase family protein [Paracoccus sp. (in: a-proteobacteria)]
MRTFLPDPLPAGALETLVAAAQSASTSSALQQWSLVCVTAPELKQKLADTIAATVPTDRIRVIEEAAALLLWVADASRSARLTEAAGRDPFVLDYLDSFLMAAVDTALAAQNAALAAESIGLGIVFLGVMRNAAEEVAHIIDLPPHSFVAFGMALGVPDPNRQSIQRPRLPQSVVLHHNGYNHNSYHEALGGYEAAYQTFREGQGMKPKTWTSSVHESMTSMDYMGGREKLRDFATKTGFKLR